MTLESLRPLQFPEDAALYITRYLRPLNEPLAALRLDMDFMRDLARKTEWYALLSAEGTGKTTLLNAIHARVREELAIIQPFPLGVFRGGPQSEGFSALLRTVERHVVHQLQAMYGLDASQWSPLDLAYVELVPRLKALARTVSRRLVLLFDDFQKLDDDLAQAFSAQLKLLHNQATDNVTVIIAGDDDIRAVRQDHSPLSGIMTAMTLLDWSEDTVQQAFLRVAGLTPGRPEDGRYLAEQTGGYPALCWAIAQQLRALGQPFTAQATAEAIEALLSDNHQLHWLRSAWRYLERGHQSPAAIYALRRLQDDLGGLRWDSPGADILFLKGVVGLSGELAVWRNPVTRRFFQQQVKLDPHSPPPPIGRKLRATGTIHVTLALNFRHFVAREDKLAFDQQRGSPEYEAALDDLDLKVLASPVGEGAPRFKAFEHWQALRNIAADLNIVRYESARSVFAHIYEMAETVPFEPSSTLQERLPDPQPGQTPAEISSRYVDRLHDEWPLWQRKSLQLTRDGLVLVRLERDVHEEDLISVSQKVVGLESDPVNGAPALSASEPARGAEDAAPSDAERRRQRRKFNEELDRSIQWEMAMAVVEMFIGDFFTAHSDGVYRWPSEERVSAMNFRKGGERQPAVRTMESAPAYPLHDRYVLFVFKKLCDCEHSEGASEFKNNIVTWDTIKNYGFELHSLLEGALVGENAKQWRLPPVKPREVDTWLASDLSSWNSELCLLSREHGVIYYDQWQPDAEAEAGLPTGSKCSVCALRGSARIRVIQFSNRPNVLYPDYWQCILFGLQYILNLRLVARLVASSTTHDLAAVADLNEKGAHDPRKIAQEVAELRQRAVTNTRLVAHLRDVTTPLFIARADYATRKFDRFIQLGGIELTLNNAESDLAEINTFLQHHDAMLSQYLTDRWTLIFSWLGVAFALFSLVSIMKDYEDSTFGQCVNGLLFQRQSLACLGETPLIFVEFISLILILLAFVSWARGVQKRTEKGSGDKGG